MQLRAAREQSGKTQVQVAQEVGISEQVYQRSEYDIHEPGVRTAIRIARALDSTVEDLFGAATPGHRKRAGRQSGEVGITKEYHRVIKNARKSRP